MISNVVSIRVVRRRNRWDFPSYDPEYEHILNAIGSSSSTYRELGQLVEFFKYGASIPAEYIDDGVLFIRAQNIRDYGIDTNDVRYIPDTIPNIDRYRAEADDILITRSGINVGDAAVIPSALSGSVHGSYSIRIRPIKAIVSPAYLGVVLNSSLVKTQVLASKGRSAQPNINIPELAALRIPLPPRSVQDSIAGVMQEAYAVRREKLAEAEILLETLDDYVLDKVGIDLPERVDNRHFVVWVSRLVGRRFDVGPSGNTFDPHHYPDVTWAPLRNLASLSRSMKTASRTPDVEFTYIGMSDVDDVTGEVHPESLLGSEINASKVVVRAGDIVFARIEPCIYNRKIALIPDAVEEALASTELLVAHANPGVVPEFLLWLLRSKLIQQQIAGKMTGTTGRRRLPDQSFGDLVLPVVSRELQQELAHEATRRRDNAKHLRAEADTVIAEAKARVELMILGEEVAV